MGNNACSCGHDAIPDGAQPMDSETGDPPRPASCAAPPKAQAEALAEHLKARCGFERPVVLDQAAETSRLKSAASGGSLGAQPRVDDYVAAVEKAVEKQLAATANERLRSDESDQSSSPEAEAARAPKKRKKEREEIKLRRKGPAAAKKSDEREGTSKKAKEPKLAAAVQKLLEEARLEHFADAFLREGIDTFDACRRLSDEDLEDDFQMKAREIERFNAAVEAQTPVSFGKRFGGILKKLLSCLCFMTLGISIGDTFGCLFGDSDDSASKKKATGKSVGKTAAKGAARKKGKKKAGNGGDGNSDDSDEDTAMGSLLTELGFSEYAEIFHSEGYDTFEQASVLSERELEEDFGMKKAQAKKLRRALDKRAQDSQDDDDEPLERSGLCANTPRAKLARSCAVLVVVVVAACGLAYFAYTSGLPGSHAFFQDESEEGGDVYSYYN